MPTTYDQAVETLARTRTKYPQYADMSDSDLAAGLAKKFPDYADLSEALKVGPSQTIRGLSDGEEFTAPVSNGSQLQQLTAQKQSLEVDLRNRIAGAQEIIDRNAPTIDQQVQTASNQRMQNIPAPIRPIVAGGGNFLMTAGAVGGRALDAAGNLIPDALGGQSVSAAGQDLTQYATGQKANVAQAFQSTNPGFVSRAVEGVAAMAPALVVPGAAVPVFAAQGAENATENIEQRAAEGFATKDEAGNTVYSDPSLGAMTSNVALQTTLQAVLAKLAPGQEVGNALLVKLGLTGPGALNVLKRLAVQTGVAAPEGVAIQAGANVVDKSTGINPDRSITEGTVEAGLQNALFAAGGGVFHELPRRGGEAGGTRLTPEQARERALNQVRDADALGGRGTTEVTVDGQTVRSGDPGTETTRPPAPRREADPQEVSTEALSERITRDDPDVKEGQGDGIREYNDAELAKIHKGEWELKEVPVEQFKQSQKNYQQKAVDEYATQSAETAPPGVAYPVDGGLDLYQGNTRLRAAIARGDKTVKVYVPKPEVLKSPGEPVKADRLPDVPQDVFDGGKEAVKAWIEKTTGQEIKKGSRNSMLDEYNAYRQRYEAGTEKANRPQLPDVASSWDAGRLKQFAKQNGYTIDDGAIQHRLQETPGMKPRDAWTQAIKEQYFRPEGEGVVGFAPEKAPPKLSQQQLAERYAKGQGFTPTETPAAPAPKPPLPRVPSKAASVSEIRKFAEEQGVTLPKFGSRDDLRSAIRTELNDRLTDLPRPPKNSRGMTLKQYRYWAEKSGYDVADVTTRGGLLKAMRTQRQEAIKTARKGEIPDDNFDALPVADEIKPTDSVFDTAEFQSPEEAGAKLRSDRAVKKLRNRADKLPDYEPPVWDGSERRKVPREPEAPFPLKEGEYTFQTPEEVAAADKAGTPVPVEKRVQQVPQTVKAAKTNPRTRKIVEALGATKDGLEHIVTPMMSQLRDVSEPIFGKVMRDLEYNPNKLTEDELRTIEPAARSIVKKLGGPKSDKYHEFFYNMHVGDFDAANKILPLEDADVQAVLGSHNRLHGYQSAKGQKVGFLDKYLSSYVNDYAGLKENKGESTGKYDVAIQTAERLKGSSLNRAERIEVINSVENGYGPMKPGSRGPTHTRERSAMKANLSLETFKQFYTYGPQAWTRYVYSAARAANRSELLGKGDPNHSIGEWIERTMKSDEKLSADQQSKAHSLIQARLMADMVAPWAATKALRQITHLSMLGQIATTVQNLADLGPTLGSYGPTNTAVGLAKGSGLSKAGVRYVREDLGLHEHGAEFRDIGKLGKAVQKTLSINLFSRINRITEQTRSNAAYRFWNQQATRNPERFAREYKKVLGDRYDQTLRDFAEGKKTDNTDFLVFLETIKANPGTMANMPPAYLNNPNLRLAYTLKSYMVTNLDLIRREGLRKIISDNPAVRREGAGFISRLLLAGVALGLGKDLISDWIRGRDIRWDQITDRSVNALLSTVMLNRYLAEKFTQDPFKAAMDFMSPPISALSSLYKDATTVGDGKGSEALKYAPLIGELLYYHTPLGAGQEKNKQRKKSELAEVRRGIRERGRQAAATGDAESARDAIKAYNSLLPKGSTPLNYGDLRFITPGGEDDQDTKRYKEDAIDAVQDGDTAKANELLKKYNAGRPNPLTMGALREAAKKE